MNTTKNYILGLTKTFKVMFASAFASILVACSSSENNFLETINQDEEKLKICIKMKLIGISIWEVKNQYYLTAEKELSMFGPEPNAIMALEDLKEAGYVDKEPFSFTGNGGFNRNANLTGHKLLAKGSKYIKWGKPLCVATRQANEVVEYTKLTEGSTTVTFKYQIEFNDLVQDTNLEERLLNRWNEQNNRHDGDGSGYFVKTNKGWSLKGLSW
jgi:hypothetical protein